MLHRGLQHARVLFCACWGRASLRRATAPSLPVHSVHDLDALRPLSRSFQCQWQIFSKHLSDPLIVHQHFALVAVRRYSTAFLPSWPRLLPKFKRNFLLFLGFRMLLLATLLFIQRLCQGRSLRIGIPGIVIGLALEFRWYQSLLKFSA